MREIRCANGKTTQARQGQRVRVIAAIVFGALFFGMSAQADRSSDPSSSEVVGEKAYWQSRYRNLLHQSERLRAEIKAEEELYADANRRNYRRGSKRHQHRIKGQEAADKLKLVQAELATIKDDGRRAGALPGWFYEVELERSSPAANASAPETGPGDAGRNPLYLEEEG